MALARKGGGCAWRGQGGFFPSVMHGLTSTGPYFVTAAFAQGARLIRNNRTRLATRRKRVQGRGTPRRKTGTRKFKRTD